MMNAFQATKLLLRVGRPSLPASGRKPSALAIALLCLTLGDGTALAQPAPSAGRPLEIMVGFPAGTAPDLVARKIGDGMQASLGQPVVVRNMPGASGNIAAAAAAKAPADGRTMLLAGNASIVVNQHIFEDLPYDPERGLSPVSRVVITPNILVVPPDLPAKTLQEFVALARAKPETVTYAHVGVGTSQHLAGVYLANLAKVQLTPVPYKGGPAIYPDLLAGRVSACFCNIATALPLVRDGKLRALAITSQKRSPSAPEIPTLDESGFSGVDSSAWFGFMVPAGTPAAAIERLQGEVRKAATAEVRKSLEDLGMIVDIGSPAEFAALIAAESAYWAKVVRANNIKAQ